MGRALISARLLAIASMALLFAVPTLAQAPAPPDLSGTWVLNAAKSKVAKKSALDPETLVIKCAGASIEFATSSNGEQSLEMFIADGKERAKDTGSGGQIYSKAQWKKSVLFTEFGGRVTAQGIGEYDFLTNKQRWSISPDGRVLTREFEDPKRTFVYDKQ
jgi:hypothetical protein